VGMRAWENLLLAAAALDEDRKVANLVGDLMQQNREHRDPCQALPGKEGRSNRKAIGEVVGGVGSKVQVAGHLHVRKRWLSKLIIRNWEKTVRHDA
jgi:hypothetical protein